MSVLKKTPGLQPEQVEMQRILRLPINEWPGPEECEIASFERLNAEAFHRGDRLFARQVAGVEAYEQTGGGLFPIGVGGGKSGLALMIAQAAVAAGIKKIMLLVPPQLAAGTMSRHVPEWRRRVPLSLTFHPLNGKSRIVRETICESGAPGVYIFPYSLLSVADTMDMLEGIAPDLVIADEAHNLKNPRAARTKRLLHFLEQDCQFVGMSGTMTSKRISDYHHLATAALGDGSPLPLKLSVAFRWGQVLDVGQGGYPDAYTRKVLEPLVHWARHTTDEDLGRGVEACRRAYQRRLVTTPGIVATSDRPEASLLFMNHTPGDAGTDLRGLVSKVEGYETPEGEPIDHAIHTHKWHRELAAGFYNSQVWPTVAELVKNRKIQRSEAEALLFMSKDHLKAQSRYRSELRTFFEDSPPGLDTPREVARSISQGDNRVPDDLSRMWRDMKGLDFPGRLERKKIPVRVDDFKIQAAVAWAKKAGRGILWVFHIEMGRWLVEALKAAGMDPLYAPAGADAEIEAVGDPEQGGQGDRIVVASVTAHGTGRNLQAFCDQLFVEWPREAAVCEQAVGRTHREGQGADQVTIHTLLATPWDHHNRSAALNDALYVQQSTSTPQRILYGDYEELPEVHSPEFLRERGFNPQPLDRDALRRAFRG